MRGKHLHRLARAVALLHDMTVSTSLLRDRLTRAHLALARGWVQGLDLRVLAQRYLAGIDGEDATDLRVARHRLQRTLDELAAAARRAGLKGASTLARQAALIRQPAGVPSLDEFAQRFDADFHSQQELLDLYQAEYGQAPGAEAARRAARRRARLVDRQLQLITELEGVVGEDLTPASALAAWFAPGIVDRLHRADLFTVAQLVDRIRSVPRRWWSGVPGIGENKGQRLRRFIEAHLGPITTAATTAVLAPAGESPGASLALPMPSAAVRKELGVVPLERLHVPNELSGELGAFRAPVERCAIAARNDYDAIHTWLSTKASALTQAAYRREAERLLLWCVLQRRKALSSLTLDDAQAYRDFIADPQPAAQWIGSKGVPRFAPLWRPFAGPLKASSQTQSLVILHGLFEWLLSTGYTTVNPFAGVRVQRATRPVAASTTAADTSGLEHDRSKRNRVLARTLPTPALQAVLEELRVLEPGGRHRRTALVLRILVSTGLRISELAAARRDHLEWIPPSQQGDGGWVLHVVGKRGKHREVPLPEDLVQALADYLAARGLPGALEDVPPGTYLIGKVDDLYLKLPSAGRMEVVDAAGGIETVTTLPDGTPASRGDGVRAQTIHHDLQRLFERVAQRLEAKDRLGAQRLRQASAHWLRHTSASTAVAAGVPLDVVGALLGHASLTTTSQYVHAESHRVAKEMRKLWKQLG
jgi:site-specific recombinase XerD